MLVILLPLGKMMSRINHSKSNQRDIHSLLETHFNRLTLISSSASNEYSWALSGNGLGLFTSYWLAGLKGYADLNSNGVVELGELYRYTEKKVMTYSRDVIGKMQSPRMDGLIDTYLPMSVVN